jgi:hypothetical protein
MSLRRAASLLATVLAVTALSAGCEPVPDTPVTSVIPPPAPLLLTNFAPQGYSAATGEVFGNRMSASGAYNTFAVKVDDPTKVRSLSQGNAIYGTEDTHRGVSDVSADGRYMLVHVERPSHFPCFTPACANASEAEPGKGAYNHVYLASTDGTQAWPLSTIDADGALGTFWARFDATGSRVVYSQIMRPAGWPEYFGGEQMVVGTITWTGGVPKLTNRVVLGNGVQFYEPYGFDPTGTAVVASSNEHAPGDPGQARISLFPLNGSAPQRLTAALGEDYQEFAFLRPDKTGYVVTSGYNGWIGGADRWLVRVATPESEPARVTNFANYKTGNPQAGISGGMAFINNSRAVVGFTRNGVEDAYIVPVPAS